jgi:hypothetical protein
VLGSPDRATFEPSPTGVRPSISIRIAARDDRVFAFKVLLRIVLAAVAVLFVAGATALFPLEHDVDAANSTGDDWFIYHLNALSVLNDGLSMPAVSGPYYRPAGFGYVYFVAGVYALAGVKSEAVYLVQGLLLVASVVGMYALFRHHLHAFTALAFAAALAVFMYLDVFRALTFRLLSENLLFPLFPLMLFFVIRGQATARLWYFTAGGAVCGLCILVRPNALPLAPAAAAVVLFFRSGQPYSRRARAAVVLLAAAAAVASLLPLRNYAATGRLTATAVTDRSDWGGNSARSKKGPLGFLRGRIDRTAARIAYLTGVPQFMRPNFRLRPHWMVMWCGFVAYLFALIKRRPEFWEVLVLVLAVSYLAPIVEFGGIASYGTRMVAPGLPLILVLAAKGGSSLYRSSSATTGRPPLSPV